MLAPIMEFAWADMAYPALVVTLGYVALGLTGFASALISVPLLAWRWPRAAWSACGWPRA